MMDCSVLDHGVSRRHIRNRSASGSIALLRGMVILTGMIITLGVAEAGTFQFLAPPQTDLNRIYKINRITGEVGACQFGLDEATPKGKPNFGVTLCYAEGPGAGAQAPSDYRLVRSHDAADGGVFRVDLNTGAISVCYVIDDKVVCTAAVK